MNLHVFAQKMPKAELHVHLEGSILPRTLIELAQRNHVILPGDDEADLVEFYRFRNFETFIKTYAARMQHRAHCAVGQDGSIRKLF